MDAPRPSGPLSLADFLDVALLGSIVLLVGASLVMEVGMGRSPPSAGPMERTLVSIFRTVGSNSTTSQTVGYLLTIAGIVMILAGPVWVFVVQPLSKRGYL